MTYYLNSFIKYSGLNMEHTCWLTIKKIGIQKFKTFKKS
jgi:hypothetical protein